MPGVAAKNYVENRKFHIDSPLTRVFGIEPLRRIESDLCSNTEQIKGFLRVYQCKNGIEPLEFRPRESLPV